MYLLDTNICISLMQGNPRAITKFNAKIFECYTCTIVLAELYKGVYCSQQWERNLITLNQFVSDILIIDFDQTAAECIYREAMQVGAINLLRKCYLKNWQKNYEKLGFSHKTWFLETRLISD